MGSTGKGSPADQHPEIISPSTCVPGVCGVNIQSNSANPMNKEAEARLAALLPQANPADLETAATQARGAGRECPH